MKDEPINTVDNKLLSIEDLCFELRAVYLLETSPQSNEYRQVLFTEEQYNNITIFIKSQMDLCKNEKHKHAVGCRVLMQEDKYTIPIREDIRAHYSKEYINQP